MKDIPVIDEDALKKGEKLFRGKWEFIAGAQSLEALPPSDLPEIAFAGRSNVGKSSLINAITGQKGLARTSRTPGRTQQINFFENEHGFRIVDLPGYGYASASKTKIASWNALIRSYIRGRRALKRAVLLIDSRHGILAADKDGIEMLQEAGVPYLVVLTKSDKVKPEELEAFKNKLEEELKGYVGAYPKIFITSSSNKKGIAELRAILA